MKSTTKARRMTGGGQTAGHHGECRVGPKDAAAGVPGDERNAHGTSGRGSSRPPTDARVPALPPRRAQPPTPAPASTPRSTAAAACAHAGDPPRPRHGHESEASWLTGPPFAGATDGGSCTRRRLASTHCPRWGSTQSPSRWRAGRPVGGGGDGGSHQDPDGWTAEPARKKSARAVGDWLPVPARVDSRPPSRV